jgi:hypothetical protein
MNKIDWRNCPHLLSLEMFISNVCYVIPLFIRNEILLRWRLGRAIIQAVSCRLPTAAARVRAQVMSGRSVVNKVALGQIFSTYFDFSCQFSFHALLHIHDHHPGLIQQADVPGGVSLTPPQEKITWGRYWFQRQNWVQYLSLQMYQGFLQQF